MQSLNAVVPIVVQFAKEIFLSDEFDELVDEADSYVLSCDLLTLLFFFVLYICIIPMVFYSLYRDFHFEIPIGLRAYIDINIS